MQTGDDLRATRLARGWSYRALAQRAGVSHKAVQYWESQEVLDPSGYATSRLAKALGRRISARRNARARRGVLSARDDFEAFCEILEYMPWRLAKRIISARVTCGAMTRKRLACRALSEPGKSRCRFHGGLSTGPRTAAGRARIAEAQRMRWAKRREMQAE